ncbi:MAG TPA: L-alanine exporter AlaE [Desulfomonilia bacterium]
MILKGCVKRSYVVNYIPTMKRIFADVIAVLTFNTVCSMIIEIFLAGMTVNQSIHARLIAIPVILILARPYGLFRDWINRILKSGERGRAMKITADVIAFVAMQVPQYSIVLKLSGANLHQIITACSSATVLMAIGGRPMGIFLDFTRWLMRVDVKD